MLLNKSRFSFNNLKDLLEFQFLAHPLNYIDETFIISKISLCIQSLAEEKQRIISSLEERKNQNQPLQQTHGSVEDQLRNIESQMRILQEEKADTERRSESLSIQPWGLDNA